MSETTEQDVVIVFGRADDALGDRIQRAARCSAIAADDLDELVALIDRHLPPVVVVDLRVADDAWSAIHRRIGLTARPGLERPVVLVAADADHWHRAVEALGSGAVDCLRLPVDDAELRARIGAAMIGRRARLAERQALGEAIHGDSLQVLAALTMRLQLVQRRAEQSDMRLDASTTAELSDIIEDLGGAVERLRSLDFELRSNERGLAAEASAAASTEPGHRSMWETPELLSRLSHDLRSPLNAVLGFAQLLELGELTPDQTDATRQIMRAGTRLLELVNEVVDLSRIEAGHLSVSLEPVSLPEVIRDAIDLMAPAALDNEVEVAAQGLAVERDAAGLDDPGTPLVLADRQRLLQVLLILLSNAVRYNHIGGHVQVHAAIEGRRLRISVIDDGIGISPEQLDKVFVPFDRLGVDKQGIDGAGLGLPIARGLVERMGGDLSVTSELGRGATFSFDLRLAPAPSTETEGEGDRDALVDADAVPFEVLYIEDNPASLRLVERILSRRPGVTLIPAMQGRLGMQLAVQRRPGMVLVDLHLPDMGGLDVVRALAAEPLTKELPVVVLSADADRQQSERAVREGARAYLSKPFQIESLLALVDTLRREAAYEAQGDRP
jgi:signal transduction histidine kinase